MRQCIVYCIVAVGLLAGGCIDHEELPPSRYIGLYGTYNEYENGSLPSKEEKYTGQWKRSDGLLCGEYRDGIPYGRWISRYSDSSICTEATYYSDGTVLSMSYFPDGLPLMASKGKYSFSDNGLKLSDLEAVFWDIAGNKVDSTQSTKGGMFKYATMRPEMPQSLEASLGWKYNLPQAWYIASGDTFSIVLYVTAPGSLPEKITIDGKINHDASVNIISADAIGEMKLKVAKSFVKDNKLNVTFHLGESVTPSNIVTISLDLNEKELSTSDAIAQ